MSEHSSSEKMAQFNTERNEYREKAIQLLTEITAKLGYSEVPVSELNLTKEEIESCVFSTSLKKEGPNIKAYVADRQDGSKVRVVVLPSSNEYGAKYAAEIYTVAFYGGSGGNHDFNAGELEDTLQTALESLPYQQS